MTQTCACMSSSMESDFIWKKKKEQKTTTPVSSSFEHISHKNTHTQPSGACSVCHNFCYPSLKSSRFRSHKLCIHIVLPKNSTEYLRSRVLLHHICLFPPNAIETNERRESLNIAYSEILFQQQKDRIFVRRNFHFCLLTFGTPLSCSFEGVKPNYISALFYGNVFSRNHFDSMFFFSSKTEKYNSCSRNLNFYWNILFQILFLKNLNKCIRTCTRIRTHNSACTYVECDEKLSIGSRL